MGPRRIAVIGAGAAGLMASIHAARPGTAEVVVFESSRDGGRKILISGGGRCNVLPAQLAPERFVTDSSPHTLRRMLCAWPLVEQIAFFEDQLRLPLVLETENGKYFPRSQSARDVRNSLRRVAVESGVRFEFEARVEDLRREQNVWRIDTDSSSAEADAVILATGGLSVPRTGSDGTGIALLERLGHRTTPTYPALTPLLGSHPGHHALAGLSLDVELSAGKGRERRSAVGGFLFTHRGYSGPAVLDLSHHFVRDPGCGLRVNWSREDEPTWERRLTRRGRHPVRAVLRERLPARLVELLMAESQCEPPTLTAELRRDQRRALLARLCAYELPALGHEGYRKAEVTGGGIELGEVDRVTLESRRQSGLYLCGELLDAFGPIGGHNFAWAWSTGRSAARGARMP